MNEYLKELNEAQQQAVVQIDKPSLVIAGAGSGKTRVLTYRIVHLLSKGCKPNRILALTFTNKAAGEMRARIASLIGEENAKSLWMGTFHSIFSKFLRIEAQSLGYTSNFSIYDASDSKNLIKNIIKELNLDDKIYKPNEIAGRISSAKNNLITASTYVSSKEILNRDAALRKPQIGEIFSIYEKRCKKADAMDFDDLLLNTNILFKNHPQILEKYQNKFDYILVDEYQDTNYSQYLIVKKLAEKHKRLCVVGDDAQSIYSFRGAKIENILNFKNDYPDYELFKLEQNYRSTRNIVNAANSIIDKNKSQIKKTVFSKNDVGNCIQVIQALTDIEEGYQVISKLLDLVYQEKYKYSDFAILYRTNAQSRIFEEALRKRNIPYKIFGGLSFYQRKEVKDMMAYLRLTVNQNDDEALKRVINYPLRGIGNTTFDKLENYSNKVNCSIWDVIVNLEKINMGLNKGTFDKIKSFQYLIQDFIAKEKELDAFELAQHIGTATGIISELYNDKSVEGVSRYDNIQELLNGIQDFFFDAQEEGRNQSLSQYFQEISLVTDMDTDKEAGADRVVLMTVHSAKGLEFKNVFIVGLEEKLFPSFMSIESPRELEEERRLFYVALTRAEKNAILSFANSRFKWGQHENAKPSRFISEIDAEYIELPVSFTGSDNEDEMEEEMEKTVSYDKFFNRQTKKPAATINKVLPPQTGHLVKMKEASVKSVSFEADDSENIQAGMNVEHERFGKGKVLAIEGSPPNTKATVFFQNAGQKQLLLKFAKLRILG
ncbi:MAG: UvrD-helicase domain-containing protein [Bacteroidales bacterium]|nr:UvrD-helicase domain-containing protein [Bacteroidales bacterium]